MRTRHARTSTLLAALLVSAAGGSFSPARLLSADAVRSTTLAAQRAVASPSVDGERLLADVRALTAPEMEGRLAGSAGSRRAQAYILERLTALRLEPIDGSHTQRFSVHPDGQGAHDATNLMGKITGRLDPGATVIVCAHYDHLGVRGGDTYPGADDNASGVAALLAIAEWFSRHTPDRSILFVAFDAEEQGLRGARHFVRNPPVDLRRVPAVVNMDMLSRGSADTLVVTGTYHYPALKPVVLEAARGRSLALTLGHDGPASGAPGRDDWTQSSDHGAFHEAGVPFLYFGVENHEDYHRPTDTADRIPVRFFVAATELVLETVHRLANP